MCNPRLLVSSSIFEDSFAASMAGGISMGFIEGFPFSSIYVSCPSVSLASIPSTTTDKSSSNSLMALFANISGMSSMSSKEVQICHTLLPSFFLRISKHWWTPLFSKFNPFVGRRIHHLHSLYASLKITEFITILNMHFNHCIFKLNWGGRVVWGVFGSTFSFNQQCKMWCVGIPSQESFNILVSSRASTSCPAAVHSSLMAKFCAHSRNWCL